MSPASLHNLVVVQKVEANSYNSFKEVESDMRLIFANARAFNEEGKRPAHSRFEFCVACATSTTLPLHLRRIGLREMGKYY